MVSIYLVMIFLGWINIYAAVYNEEHKSIFDLSENYGKQVIWIGSSIAIAAIILMLDGKFFTISAYPIYGVVMLTLILVLVFGREVAGSKSWFEVGSFRIQPAEFGKFATSLVIAKYLSTLNIKFEDNKTKLITALFIGTPALLILLQNDTGSALVYGAFLFVLYREGLSGNFLMAGVAVVVVFIVTLLFDPKTMMWIVGILALLIFIAGKRSWRNALLIGGTAVVFSGMSYSVGYVVDNVLEKHQKTRINVMLGKEDDPKGVGYNVNQSKIAIGSGGFSGKGFLNGTQTKYKFVPEQSTDFIFCTVGEEWGFMGSAVVIILFMILLVRIVFVAERQKSTFSRIYGYGVASVLFFHFAVNIAMTIGLAPVIGIPLPFFSYGGSSLWAFTLLLFVFIKLDAYRMQLLR
ncbi:MAG: putative lipid II flippase FtsW [Bacteroidia bacterium]|nr:putative lipid II flippase FtsW [Bacteroidia bacterium]